MGQCSYNIKIKQGANFYWPLLIVDEVDGVEVPVDLTGFDCVMQIKKTFNSSTTLDEYSITNGKITFNELLGEIFINAPAVDTAAYPDDFIGKYDIKLTDDTGFVDRIIQGDAVVDPQVTI